LKRETLLEAALFSAGRAVSLEELQAATRLPPDDIRKGIKDLTKGYDKRGSALDVIRIGRDKFLMKVRDDCVHVATDLAKTELPREVLKTAALIAYHQPVLQKDLNLMLGSKIYEHVRILREKSLIRSRPSGRTFEITTTQAFPEYFGIEASSREDMKKVLADRMGIEEVVKEEQSRDVEPEEKVKGIEPAEPVEEAVPEEPQEESEPEKPAE
jgi:segregation and condensation protein B